ncbi:hypothetical protein GF359_06670 [candidate division WOR-3 bacterium]|uniref:Uncharacterized protein n=1 Tax=candidate division WOR-3 bacterium TaxID=2052148 RepID=A0A9D5K9H7_UNCW3|nr:hypothetical protein [candidate division WOR-3 bacterium]MBD3364882.1 hypothetical protein [candidate division WOR-3 bacterium]
MKGISYISIFLAITISVIGQSIDELEEFTVTYDEFEEFTVTSIPYHRIPLNSNYGNLYLEPRQVVQGSRTWYWLCLKYIAPEGIYLSYGGRLVFLVDGEKMTLNVNMEGSDWDVSTAGGTAFVHEWAPCRITTTELKKLAFADEAKIRVYGSESYVDGSFTQQSSEMIRLFYDAVVEDKWMGILEERKAEEQARVQAEEKASLEREENARIKREQRLTADSLFVFGVVNNIETAEITEVLQAINVCDSNDWETPAALTTKYDNFLAEEEKATEKRLEKEARRTQLKCCGNITLAIILIAVCGGLLALLSTL